MKIGICFAGGGIKGAAHIGALKAFEEENIEFEYVAGTSSGSIISVLYSLGYNSSEIYEMFKKYMNKIKYADSWNIFKLIIGLLTRGKIVINGLNSGSKIEKIVSKECNRKNINNISEINKKVLIPSVDMCDGKIYIFSSITNRETYSDNVIYINDMEIGKAVRASCSYPGVFSPMKYENTYLIDGGIRENVPWKELKNSGAEKVISIVFQNEIKKKEEVNILDVVTKSIDILCYELSTYELEGADYLIKIKTKDIHLLDKKKFDYLYNLGYIETKGKIKEIKEKLQV